jgi:PAS domain S-box-containing protein
LTRAAKSEFGEWELDLATGLLKWSEQTFRIFEIEPEGFSGTHEEFLSRVYPEDRALIEQVQRDAITNHAMIEIEFRIVTPGNGIRWVHKLGHIEFDDAREARRILGTCRDVTRRKHTESRLALLATAVEHVGDIILVTEACPLDEPGPRIIYVNDAFRRITGYTEEETLGRTPRMLQGPRTQRSELDRIRAALSAWLPVRAELINYTKSGEEFWVEIDIFPIRRGEERPSQWVSIQRNIGERKEKDALLARAQKRIDLLLQSTSAGIIGVDSLQTILFANAAACAMFGWDEGDMIGRNLHELVHHHRGNGDDFPIKDCPINQTLLTGEMRQVSGDAFFRKDGKQFPVDYLVNPMRDSDGSTLGAVVNFRDTTEELRLQSRLRQTQRLESVGLLTGGIAHDFNNLLTVILGNAEVLSEDLTTQPRLANLAELVTRAALRGANLTQQLLAFSRQQPLEPTVVDVNRLISEFEHLLRSSLGEHIEMLLKLDKSLAPSQIDPTQLESAILNLCLNSGHAMPGGGRLTIETSNVMIGSELAEGYPELQPGPYVLVAVSDTGCGIAPDDLPRVFDPFFTTREKGKGSGLGLSMIYGFIKQSRGHISIYSEVGIGTTVKMYLPRSSVDDAPVLEQLPVLPDGGTATILLVEDDELVRRYAEDQLVRLGYRVLTAENGWDALKLIETGTSLDLLFTDVVMPGQLNGRELADRARLVLPQLKVLYSSGYTQNAIVHQGRLDPGVHLLVKPYRHKELAIAIRKALDDYSAHASPAGDNEL